MMNRVFKRRQPKKFTDFNTKPSQRVKMSLRVRDNNQINVDNNNLIPQGRALKRSAEFQVLKLCEDEPVAKRPIKAGECEAISSYQIDAIKKNSTTILSLRKNKFERLLPLKDVFDAEELEVDPCPGFDFDKENSNDPNSVSEFACDIFKYLKWREPHFMPTNYIGRHKYLNGKSRAVLVDWLVEVHGAFKQNHETLYMAVNLVDRFFSNSKKNYQRSPASYLRCGFWSLLSLRSEVPHLSTI
ncbi:unnamed protein product [Bursaphelenchus okinawaensis]|uniref:Cyclin N-terminal domain-containing protein n=1 Tax=Bursaphelenchus okinawaensis TaxID=465554 RepID=A0A811LJY8_9BILA|nr:unnamed protein product [Bursaphelenchus okinawaensis]CAG9127321.1 unnamed protein product [Bursaphelenchus okinawaensis]